MNTRPNPVTLEPQGEFQFERMHIPTCLRSMGWAPFPRQRSGLELDALHQIETWNWQQPGVWLYRIVP